jgi:group I intron endonuclease
MPYKADVSGIYRVINTVAKECYVGKTKGIKKRVHEHFRLLRKNQHPNDRLQKAFNRDGQEAFTWEVEVLCDDPEDLIAIEEAFLQGRAAFTEPSTYNISCTSHAPMAHRRHSEEVRQRIRLGRRASTFDYKSEEYRAALSKAQLARYQKDPKFIEKLRFILDNPQLTYAARARAIGSDTSSVRKLALKYPHLKGTL